MVRREFVAAIVICILAFASPAFAQGLGDIVGRVTDASDAVLPGVTITATNQGTSVARTTVTSDTGDYVFTSLPIGAVRWLVIFVVVYTSLNMLITARSEGREGQERQDGREGR